MRSEMFIVTLEVETSKEEHKKTIGFASMKDAGDLSRN